MAKVEERVGGNGGGGCGCGLVEHFRFLSAWEFEISLASISIAFWVFRIGLSGKILEIF